VLLQFLDMTPIMHIDLIFINIATHRKNTKKVISAQQLQFGNVGGKSLCRYIL
jgi:hypothetical protein